MWANEAYLLVRPSTLSSWHGYLLIDTSRCKLSECLDWWTLLRRTGARINFLAVRVYVCCLAFATSLGKSSRGTLVEHWCSSWSRLDHPFSDRLIFDSVWCPIIMGTSFTRTLNESCYSEYKVDRLCLNTLVTTTASITAHRSQSRMPLHPWTWREMLDYHLSRRISSICWSNRWACICEIGPSLPQSNSKAHFSLGAGKLTVCRWGNDMWNPCMPTAESYFGKSTELPHLHKESISRRELFSVCTAWGCSCSYAQI